MKDRFSEYFEMLLDSDFDEPAPRGSWIYECPGCQALYSSKAIPGRSIFPWFGYAPNDGNVLVVSNSMRIAIEMKVQRCKCGPGLKMVRTVARLRELIESHETYGIG